MNRMFFAILITLFSFTASANGPAQYLCITEDKTGFNWGNGKWVQVNFVESKYILKRPNPENQFHHSDQFAWVLIRFGDKDEFPSSGCNEDFNELGYLHCGKGRLQFKLNRQNLYFGLSSITGALNTERPSDCPDKELSFWDAVLEPNSKYLECKSPDSMVLEYGKCSPF